MSVSVKLRPKQQRFVEEFLVDLNATQAAIRAGYSPRTAYSIGWENLNKPDIQVALRETIEAHFDQAELTIDRVIEGLMTEALYYGPQSSHGARVAAWGHLGKYMGMFVERHELSLDPNGGTLIDRMQQRYLQEQAANVVEGTGRSVNGHRSDE
jgi:phage terminase small subunit